MAESLSAWMTNSVALACGSAYTACSSQEDGMSMLQDTPYGKGSKVQIIRFLGFGQHGTHVETCDSDVDDDDNDDGHIAESSMDALKERRSKPLWAVVGDRKSRVCVKFSRECVRRFDGGSIIALRRYRPAVSMHAAHLYALENDASVTGPFAAAARLTPRLCLQVEDVFLWGSVNAPTFWDANDLQAQLSSQSSAEQTFSSSDEAQRLFRKWFGKASGELMRRRRHVKRKAEGKLDSTSNPASLEENVGRTQSVAPPPPYQRPLPPKAKTNGDKGSTSLASATDIPVQPLQGWGDFSLSWTDDEFGLDRAIGDMIQSKKGENGRDDVKDLGNELGDGDGSMEGQQSSDPFSLSAQESSHPDDLESWRTGRSDNAEESAQEHPRTEKEERNDESTSKKRAFRPSDADSATAERVDEAHRSPAAKMARMNDASHADVSEGDWSTLLAYDDE